MSLLDILLLDCMRSLKVWELGKDGIIFSVGYL